jgi:hypothetical protein
MRYLKKILLVLFIVFVGIQFIKPVRNQSGQVLPTDITKTYHVPDSVLSILKIACYNCHSNNTIYPWYDHVQPICWILSNHIKNGKDKLNFSDFGSYSKRRQKSKLKSIASQVKDGKMPLSSYTILHKDAKLTTANKTLIMNWANIIIESLSTIN